MKRELRSHRHGVKRDSMRVSDTAAASRPGGAQSCIPPGSARILRARESELLGVDPLLDRNQPALRRDRARAALGARLRSGVAPLPPLQPDGPPADVM